MELLPPPDLFGAFLIAGLALNITPGADMTYVALAGARGGRRAGWAAAGGVFVGCLVHIAFAVVGLSALIAASQAAFAVIKWLGVAYLVYLVVRLLTERAATERKAPTAPAITPATAFREATVVNVLNPKVGIFFLAFLPQFIETSAASPALQVLTLGVVFNLTGFMVNAVVGAASASAARRFGNAGWLPRAARFAAASVIGALVVKLALTRAAD